MTINHLGIGLAVKNTPVVDPVSIPAGLFSKAFLPVNVAGSSSSLLLELRNLVAFGLPLEDALTAMTIAPAKAVRLDKTIGSIAVGKVVDLLMLDEKLNLAAVYISGQKL